ncbi:MAG: DciA family protein [Lawsonella sp.]
MAEPPHAQSPKSDAVFRTLQAAIQEARAQGHSVGKGRNSTHRRRSASTENKAGDGAYKTGAQGNQSASDYQRPRYRTAGRATQGRRKKYGWTGSGPDRWDPQPLTALFADSVDKQGWRDELMGGRVVNAWPRIVGKDIAEHCVAEKLEDGVLHIKTATTSWATQLQMMQRQILKQIGKEFGSTVKQLSIKGPQGPSWRKGPLHVPGRGPRDTYG